MTDTTWFAANSPLDCTIDDSALTITCTNFAPLADHFTMAGTIDGKNVNLNITVDASQITRSAQYTSGVFAPYAVCGQYGAASAATASHYTTVQRMYDCSKRVTSYAGQGKSDGSFDEFTLGTSDPSTFWFLVGCPNASNQTVNHELCSWLSPKIQENNPVVLYSLQCNGSNCDPTSKTVAPGKRILWSGLLGNGANSYIFYNANGRSALDGRANCDENGKCACYLTLAGLNNCSDGSGFMDTSFQSYQQLQATRSLSLIALPNLCTQQLGLNSSSFSGMVSNSSYSWKIPTNSLLMTLTGGTKAGSTAGYCESPTSGPNGYTQNKHAYCISTASDTPFYLGFRAIDAIPSFQAWLWSSSVWSDRIGWVFIGDNGGAVFTGNIQLDNRGVRCASLVW